jgi:methyl-accepting chemotaxis protein
MARSSDSVFPISLIRDRTFQAREIRRVIKLSLIYLAVTTVLVGVFYQQMLGRLIEGMAPLLFVSEDMALATEAVPSLASVLGKWLLAMIAVNVVITVALGTYITRKLGQPLLAIKRSLREVAAGNLDVKLRASDDREFGELANELALALHRVREKVAEAKQGLDNESAESAVSECRDALDWFQTSNAANDEDSVTKAA